MRYRARPVEVEAYEIISVGDPTREDIFDLVNDRRGPARGSRFLILQEGKAIWAAPEQLARMTPEPGDFVIVQEDGYTYLNPREVFLRKYEPAAETAVSGDPS